MNLSVGDWVYFEAKNKKVIYGKIIQYNQNSNHKIYSIEVEATIKKQTKLIIYDNVLEESIKHKQKQIFDENNTQ